VLQFSRFTGRVSLCSVVIGGSSWSGIVAKRESQRSASLRKSCALFQVCEAQEIGLKPRDSRRANARPHQDEIPRWVAQKELDAQQSFL
jgi:hypothetical protein